MSCSVGIELMLCDEPVAGGSSSVGMSGLDEGREEGAITGVGGGGATGVGR